MIDRNKVKATLGMVIGIGCVLAIYPPFVIIDALLAIMGGLLVFYIVYPVWRELYDPFNRKERREKMKDFLYRFKIYKEKPDVISQNACYIIFDRRYGYFYGSESILGLLKIISTEWKNDKHLIG